MKLTAEDLRKIADMANNEDNGILYEIKMRAFNGHYNDAGYDILKDNEIKLLKSLGFKVTTGQNTENPWYVVEW